MKKTKAIQRKINTILDGGLIKFRGDKADNLKAILSIMPNLSIIVE